MLDILYELFGIIGFDITIPATFSEMIPYFLKVLVSMWLLSSVFAFFNAIGRGASTGGRRI